MGIKITDMTAAGSSDGTEIIPTSKSAAPKSVTTANIKDYVIDQIEAIAAAGAVDGNDQVFILDNTDSALKPVDIDLVAQHAIDTIWGKAAETAPDDADVMPLLDGSTEKTVTLTKLAEYVRSAIEATILDVSDLSDGSGTLATTDYMLVTQGSTGKQITVQDLYDAIYDGLAAHVNGKTALADPAVDADVLYAVRGGTGYKITMAQIATHAAASATINGSGTADYIAQWTDSDTLKAGPELILDATGFTAGSDTAIPTTAAVRSEMDEIINDATDIGAAIVSTDTFLIDDGAVGTQRKSAVSRLKTYLETSGVYKTIFIPAALMRPTTTAGCAALAKNEYATNDINLDYLAFDGAAADEHAEFDLLMPEDWDLGTIKYKVFWSNAAGATAADDVSFYMSAGALSDDDAIDAALGTLQLVTDALTADGDMHATAASPALTIGGTPALGDWCHFKISRDYDYGATPMTEDAWLFGVWIQYLANVVPAAW